MFSLLGDARQFLKSEAVSKDNSLFKLHYKVTVGILGTCSILLGARQYFGDPIDCHVNGVPDSIMDSYCWIHGTWTIRELVLDLMRPHVAHPGIGFFDPMRHEKIHHRYYQWVPLVMAITAACFYAPKFLWQMCEDGWMETLCTDEIKRPIYTRKAADRQIQRLEVYYNNNHRRHQSYAFKYFLCEALNLVNVCLQWTLTNQFLNGSFSLYGASLMHYFSFSGMLDGKEELLSPAEAVFPKLTQCTFYKHGPSGDIQRQEGLCVLPLNVVNEKIYCLLWIWYFLLICLTSVFLFWRLTAILMTPMRRWMLHSRCQLGDYKDVSDICNECSLGDWYVLRQMSKNIDPELFAKFLRRVAKVYRKETEGRVECDDDDGDSAKDNDDAASESTTTTTTITCDHKNGDGDDDGDDRKCYEPTTLPSNSRLHPHLGRRQGQRRQQLQSLSSAALRQQQQQPPRHWPSQLQQPSLGIEDARLRQQQLRGPLDTPFVVPPAPVSPPPQPPPPISQQNTMEGRKRREDCRDDMSDDYQAARGSPNIMDRV